MRVSWDKIREVHVERRKKREINYPTVDRGLGWLERPPVNTYPHEAGYKKPGTSSEAAQLVNPGLSEAKQRMLQLLMIEPMTPKRMTDKLNAEGFLLKGGTKPYENYCRSRFSELKAEGCVEETGLRGISGRGNNCDMVKITDLGKVLCK